MNVVQAINNKIARKNPNYELRYYPASEYNKHPCWQFAKKLMFTDCKYVYKTVYSEKDAVIEVNRILAE